MSQLSGSFDFDPFAAKVGAPTQAPPKPVASPVPVAPVQQSEFLNHLRRIYSATGLQNPNQQVGPPAPTRGEQIRSAAGAEAAPVQAPGRIGLRDRLNAIQNERFRTLQSLSPNMTPEQRLMLIQHRQGLDQEQKFVQGIQRADEVRPQLDQGPPTPEIAEAIDTGTTAKQQYMTQLQDMANRKERARQLEKLGIYGDPNMAADQADEMDTRKAATAAQLRLLNAKALGAEYDANPELRMLRDSLDLGQKEAAFGQQLRRGEQELELGALKIDEARYESDPEYRKAMRVAQLEAALANKDKAKTERQIAGYQNARDLKDTALGSLKNDPELSDIVDSLSISNANVGFGDSSLPASKESSIDELVSNVDALEAALSKYSPEQRATIARQIRNQLKLERKSENEGFWDTILKSGPGTKWLYTEGNTPQETGARRIKAAKQINRLIRLLNETGSPAPATRDPERPM